MPAPRAVQCGALAWVGLGALALWAHPAAAEPAPETTATPSGDPSTTPQTAEPAVTPDDGTTAPVEPLPPPPEPATAVCTPECPEGASCIDGQCFVACDPAHGDCQALVAGPAVEPEPEPEPEPELGVIEAEPDPDSDSDMLGLGLRIAPGVSACIGSGCRSLQIGSARGSMGVGGALDLRLAYRAAPHLSFEAGGLVALHGNDIDSDPSTLWFAALVGPRLHLSGGRWRAEPVVGLQLAYVRSLVRWSNAGAAADGLGLGADAGVSLRLSERLSLGMLTGLILPYWTRVCDADSGIKQCYGRSELNSADLRRSFWTTSLALVVRF